ncbi:hypothetical protein [Streptomyces tsukubensis]|uniref:Uncharacterized protein n=1 Tax=Streptomyces tsukubensis TaxID=83656 RepID=A0A1V4ABI6_9ACTN|nr:hypothetical protein [Streptomyces tsukubensis]OON80774.1 hypothetical protein B1H18_10240 [Streptomyces tsukubensis]QFR93585.1 hypothetical protein GBW32_11425 [Streptomyces tsukubensis]
MLKLYCETCKADEEHRELSGERERGWVRSKTGKKYVHDYWMCANGDCRRVRYRWSSRSPRPVMMKMPDFD